MNTRQTFNQDDSESIANGVSDSNPDGQLIIPCPGCSTTFATPTSIDLVMCPDCSCISMQSDAKHVDMCSWQLVRLGMLPVPSAKNLLNVRYVRHLATCPG